MQPALQVHERPGFGPGILLSLQHLFAMFGSTVLVPVIFGVDPATVLLMNGIVTLLVILLGSVLFRGFLRIIPILVGFVVGYLVAWSQGLVRFDSVGAASAFALPEFTTPSFNLSAILIIAPAALVVIAEHIGHLIVTGNMVGKDLSRDPGLHRSLLGNGLSTLLSGFVGSTPNTTYGENIGVMAITRVYSVWVIGGAAVIAIIMSFIGKLSALIGSIPEAVIGGASLMLFGVIAAAGIRMLVETKVNYAKPSNIVLTTVVLVLGISGTTFKWGYLELKGMALATVTAILLSLVFKAFEKIGWLKEDDSAAQ